MIIKNWPTDISEFIIAAGKLYLSSILDLHNRKILSDISASPSFVQITNMLDEAFSKYGNLEVNDYTFKSKMAVSRCRTTKRS